MDGEAQRRVDCAEAESVRWFLGLSALREAVERAARRSDARWRLELALSNTTQPLVPRLGNRW